MPVPRKAWLQTCVEMPATLARLRTMAQALEPPTVELRQAAAVWPILDGLELGHSPGLAQPGAIDVFGEVAFEGVMAGYLVKLAAPFSCNRTQRRRC